MGSRSSLRGTACPTHAVGRVALFYKREPEVVLSDTFLFLLPGDLQAFGALDHMPAVVHAKMGATTHELVYLATHWRVNAS